MKRVNRVYREMGLQLRNEPPKRKVKAKLREDRQVLACQNDVWAMNFVHDQLFDGRKTRVLTMVECVHTLLAGDRGSVQLARRDCGRCARTCLQGCRLPPNDQGRPRAEFISKYLDLWAYRRGVALNFSRPGKPTDNAYIESLNGKCRAECLNAQWSTSIEEMRRICEDWRRNYNEVRPHSALGNKPPMALMNCSGHQGPS